jgi:tRNA-dihydrouridine synthase B
MRDPASALKLIEAVVAATTRPVTLKMRLGWDQQSINAPEIAQRAQAAGIRLLTVHARTRCDFFKGQADWQRVAEVKAAVGIPVIINGDVVCPRTAQRAIGLANADGVMVGRGAYGAPWVLGRIARALGTGWDPGNPPLHEQRAIALEHVESMLHHYGQALGIKNARKHVGWYLQSSGRDEAAVKRWRRQLCTQEQAAPLLHGLAEFYSEALELAA